MQRVVSIDIVKGICIILVVIGHYIPENSPEWYKLLNRLIYSFHMPLFMFASGYVYMATKKEGQYGRFIWKKTKRLLIPYVSTSVIIISLKLLSQKGMYVENPVTITSYLKMFCLPEAGYFLWFVWALWEMFLVIPLFNTPQKRVALFLVSLFLGLIPIHTEYFCIREFLIMLKYFVLGVILCEHSLYLKKIKKIPAILIMGVFMATFATSRIITNVYFSGLMDILLPYLGICMVCLIAREIHARCSSLTHSLLIVSVSSYTIYLFHTTFEGFAKAMIYKISFFTNNASSFIFTIGAIAVIALGGLMPLLLHQYVLTRSKILRTLFGVSGR